MYLELTDILRTVRSCVLLQLIADSWNSERSLDRILRTKSEWPNVQEINYAGLGYDSQLHGVSFERLCH